MISRGREQVFIAQRFDLQAPRASLTGHEVAELLGSKITVVLNNKTSRPAVRGCGGCQWISSRSSKWPAKGESTVEVTCKVTLSRGAVIDHQKHQNLRVERQRI